MIGSLRADFIGYLCSSGVSAQVVSARAPVPSASAALICAVDGSVVVERLGQPACGQRRSEVAIASDHGRGRQLTRAPLAPWHACHDAP